MKNITVIDNKEFLNDYIGFERVRYSWRKDKPTTKCFVHVWQRA